MHFSDGSFDGKIHYDTIEEVMCVPLDIAADEFEQEIIPMLLDIEDDIIYFKTGSMPYRNTTLSQGWWLRIKQSVHIAKQSTQKVLRTIYDNKTLLLKLSLFVMSGSIGVIGTAILTLFKTMNGLRFLQDLCGLLTKAEIVIAVSIFLVQVVKRLATSPGNILSKLAKQLFGSNLTKMLGFVPYITSKLVDVLGIFKDVILDEFKSVYNDHVSASQNDIIQYVIFGCLVLGFSTFITLFLQTGKLSCTAITGLGSFTTQGTENALKAADGVLEGATGLANAFSDMISSTTDTVVKNLTGLFKPDNVAKMDKTSNETGKNLSTILENLLTGLPAKYSELISKMTETTSSLLDFLTKNAGYTAMFLSIGILSYQIYAGVESTYEFSDELISKYYRKPSRQREVLLPVDKTHLSLYRQIYN